MQMAVSAFSLSLFPMLNGGKRERVRFEFRCPPRLYLGGDFDFSTPVRGKMGLDLFGPLGLCFAEGIGTHEDGGGFQKFPVPAYVQIDNVKHFLSPWLNFRGLQGNEVLSYPEPRKYSNRYVRNAAGKSIGPVGLVFSVPPAVGV